MMDKKSTVIGTTCICALLLSAGCKSAMYEKEAEGLEADESVITFAAEGIPGGVVFRTMAVQAKVLDINYKKREVKLLIPGGSVMKTKVGPEAVNFDQVKKGDIINAVINEEVVVQLAPSEADLKDSAEVVALLAEKGDMPAGMMEAAVRITAKITAIDVEAYTLTLAMPDGTSKTVSIRADLKMDQAKVGDQVVIDMFEAVAISVDHQPNK